MAATADFVTICVRAQDGNLNMKHFKLGFRNCSADEQLGICDRVVENIGNLPEERRNGIAVDDLHDIVAAARDSHDRILNLRAALKAEVAARKERLGAAREAVSRASFTAAYNAKFQPRQMAEAGLKPVAGWRRVGIPDAPDNLRAEAMDIEGAVRLRWKRSVRRCIFKIQMTRDISVETGWKLAASSGRQTCDVTELKSGVKYWFRVAASNAHGQGPWSQPVGARVK